MSKNAKIIDILELINQEMILLDLWQSTLPSKEALASEEPFCCDTLTFTQWLEFILLPKMSMLLDSDLPLPSEFEILPMAEQSLDQTKHQQLIALISQLDAQF
ncbi:MAG: YqcC family protein [Gammaproteobacteria bacterium]|nr:YqcC family protein [Gammaproteobacteria bacterium]